MLRKMAIAMSVAFASCSIAQAADMPKPVYRAPPAPVVVAYNWSGFYLGANFGYGTGDLNATAWGSEASGNIDGWFAGAQIGWNWQAPGSPWVWGVEFDWQGSDIGSDVTATNGNAVAIATAFTDLEQFGTARLRLGYAWDRVLPYVTGGFAWGRNQIGASAAIAGFTSVETTNTHIGWTVGAGVEWALLDNWSVKIEYLYLGLGNENYFPNTFNGLGFDADLDVHTIKLGLNYRFGYNKSPVIGRY